MDDWQAEQHRDECMRQQEIVTALKRAEAAGTPKDVIDLLAYEAGVSEIYTKENKR